MMIHPLVALWEATGQPPPNFQGKARKVVEPPTPRDGVCAITGEQGPVWPVAKVSTTLTTIDRMRHRDADPQGLALGPAGAWAVRHRVAMQQVHIAPPGKPLVPAGPMELRLALCAMPGQRGWWVLVPQSRQKHLLPWADPGTVRVDDETLRWTHDDVRRLAAYAELRDLGFGETAQAHPAPPWPVLAKLTAQQQIRVLTSWDLLTQWRKHPAYLDVAARATRKPKETPC